MSNQLKNIIIAGIIILLSIFLGYNLFLNYEIKSISNDLKHSFNENNKSNIYFKNAGYNYFEKIYVNDLYYYDNENDDKYEIENITFTELDLGNKIPRYIKAKISNTNLNSLFKDSSDNIINFDYQYDSEKQIMDFNILQKIENIGDFKIKFNVENVILNTLTDGFLSNNFHLHSFNFNKIFNRIKHIDNITITLNNDEFLKVFSTFLVFNNPEDKLDFYEYSFSQKESENLKQDLLKEINKLKNENRKFYSQYLEVVEEALINNKKIAITFDTKSLYNYNSYDNFLFDLAFNKEKTLNTINLSLSVK